MCRLTSHLRWAKLRINKCFLCVKCLILVIALVVPTRIE